MTESLTTRVTLGGGPAFVLTAGEDVKVNEAWRNGEPGRFRSGRFAIRRCAVNPLLQSGWAANRNALPSVFDVPASTIEVAAGRRARRLRHPVEMGRAHREPHRTVRIGHPARRLPPARPRHPHRPPARRGRRARGLAARGHRRRVPAVAIEPDESYDVVVLALVGGAVQADAARPRPRLAGPRAAARRRHRLRRRRLREARRRAAAAARRGPRPRQLPPRRGPFPRGVRGRRRRRLGASTEVRAAVPRRRRPTTAKHDPYTVVFAAQPSVPENRADRTYLLRRLVEHARLHPDREVLLKLRTKPGEHTTHIEELPYQKLAASGSRRTARQLPPGVRATWARSSTAPTCWSRSARRPPWSRCTAGIPTAVLTDLGVREVARQPPLPRLRLPRLLGPAGRRAPARSPTREWVARQGVAADGSYEHGLRRGPRSGSPRCCTADRLPPLTPYYTARHRPRLSARHPRPPPPRPGRRTAARRAPPPTRRPADCAGRAQTCARGGPRRLPPRRAARGPRHPADGGAVTAPTPASSRKEPAMSNPKRARAARPTVCSP